MGTSSGSPSRPDITRRKLGTDADGRIVDSAIICSRASAIVDSGKLPLRMAMMRSGASRDDAAP